MSSDNPSHYRNNWIRSKKNDSDFLDKIWIFLDRIHDVIYWIDQFKYSHPLPAIAHKYKCLYFNKFVIYRILNYQENNSKSQLALQYAHLNYVSYIIIKKYRKNI